ncbi:MAG: helix-turn-helix transcriptional regulator [Proteobacteria bacterium]|nr:helix-turn-helix transcriptional regulator [Pseudomonadota bacterium]
MKVKGSYEKTGKWWAIQIPEIGMFTQGRTKANAFEMIKDAASLMLSDPEVTFTTFDIGDGEFYLEASDVVKFLAFALRQLRCSQELTYAATQSLTGAKSRSEFAVYESGNTDPTLSKTERLLGAMGMSLVLVKDKDLKRA